MNQQSIHDRIMARNQGKGAVRVGIEDRSRPQRNRAKTAVFSLLAIAVVATAGFAAMRYGLLHNLLPQPAVAETNQPNPALAETPFLQHAKEAGLQSCSNIFPALGQMLTTGTTYSVQSIWNNEAPDKHLVEALVGMNYATQGYSGPAAGLVFAAPRHPFAKVRWSGWRHSRPIAPMFRPCFRKTASLPTILDKSASTNSPMEGATRCCCQPATAASSFPWPRQQENKEAYNEG